jgi:hypothetical protein
MHTVQSAIVPYLFVVLTTAAPTPSSLEAAIPAKRASPDFLTVDSANLCQPVGALAYTECLTLGQSFIDIIDNTTVVVPPTRFSFTPPW